MPFRPKRGKPLFDPLSTLVFPKYQSRLATKLPRRSFRACQAAPFGRGSRFLRLNYGWGIQSGPAVFPRLFEFGIWSFGDRMIVVTGATGRREFTENQTYQAFGS